MTNAATGLAFSVAMILNLDTIQATSCRSITLQKGDGVATAAAADALYMMLLLRTRTRMHVCLCVQVPLDAAF